MNARKLGLCLVPALLALGCASDEPGVGYGRDDAGQDPADMTGSSDIGSDSGSDIPTDIAQDPADSTAEPPDVDLGTEMPADLADAVDQPEDIADDTELPVDPELDGPSDPELSVDPEMDGPSDPDHGEVDAGGSSCPGSPICGTPFEALEVIWSDPLYLCTSWEAGPAFDLVRQRKVQLVLPPQRIDGLFAPALAGPFSDRVIVARGPYGGQRRYVEDGTSIGSVLEYEVEDAGATSHFHAEIQHILGEAGVLFQHIDLERSAGDTTPLDYRSLDEVGMTFELPDGELVSLTLCSRLSMTEASVEVLAAHSTSDEVLTALRMWGSGSDSSWYDRAVVPLFTPFRTAIDPGLGFTLESAGYWTGLRAVAEDGIWEETEFDPAADYLNASWGVLRGNLVRFSRAEGEEAPTVNLTTEEGSTEYTAYSDWVAVDNEHLASSYASLCADLEVQSASTWGGYTFQIIGCPDESPLGFDQMVVVPVEYRADPSQVGTAWTDGVEIEVDSRPAIRFTFASGSFTLIRRAPGSFSTWEYVAASSIGTTISSGWLWQYDHIAEVYEQDRHGAVLVERWYQSRDSTIQLHQVLFNAGVGTAGTRPYHAVSQELVWPGGVRFVDALDRMNYTTTHHNMADSFQSDSDDIRFTWTSEGAGMGNLGSYWIQAWLLSDETEVIPLTPVYPVE